MVLIESSYLSYSELDVLMDKKFAICGNAFQDMLPQADGKVQEKLVVPVKLSNGKERAWIPNKTSVKTLVKKFGNETDDWVGKEAEFEVLAQKIQGQNKRVLYVKE